MADRALPGVNMPKKRDPRLRQMQAPQQQQFFDSADYEVRKQQQQQQQQATHSGNLRAGYAGAPQAPQPSPQHVQRQAPHVVPPPPSAPQNNARVPPHLQSPAY